MAEAPPFASKPLHKGRNCVRSSSQFAHNRESLGYLFRHRPSGCFNTVKRAHASGLLQRLPAALDHRWKSLLVSAPEIMSVEGRHRRASYHGREILRSDCVFVGKSSATNE